MTAKSANTVHAPISPSGHPDKPELLLNHIALELVPIDAVKPAARQVRIHTESQLTKLAASVDRFGFVTPIIIDSHGSIIAGHGRVEAARRLNMTRIPALRIDHLTDAEIRAYRLADNKLAELSAWDEDALRLEFSDLLELDCTFDLETAGFEVAEIDIIMQDTAEVGEDDPGDEVLEPNTVAVSRVGDLWNVGVHLVLCGDALEAASYETLLSGNPARLCFTDAPYNVKINGNVCGRGQIKHREFAMGSGEMADAEFEQFLSISHSHIAAHLVDCGLIYSCMDWRSADKLVRAGKSIGLKHGNTCVWVKDNAGLGSFYRSRHEFVVVFKKGDAPHLNTVELGKHGRSRSNVWMYPGVNTLKQGRMAELAMHPTVKPVALIADAIKDCSRRGDIVLDPFAGSGSTLIAAERVGRKARVMELDPLYVDTILRRFQHVYGVDAVHAESGCSFPEITERRLAEVAEDGINKPGRTTVRKRKRPADGREAVPRV